MQNSNDQPTPTACQSWCLADQSQVIKVHPEVWGVRLAGGDVSRLIVRSETAVAVQ